jgi:Ca2+:H+ antiporter
MGKGKHWFTPSIHWLLAFVPVAFLLQYVKAWHNPIAVFTCSGLAIIPLAALMGEATENLATRLGQGVGGLLNATFGNAAELIIALFALSKGLVNVVKASITGSIIGNILFVLGLSMALGGYRFETQKFNRTAVRTGTTSLLLAAIALFTPTIFHAAAAERPGGWTAGTEQTLSLGIAIILLLSYGCTLLFSLKTHKDLFTGQTEEPHDPEQTWSNTKAILVLLIATLLTGFLAEFLVGAIEHTRQSLGLTETFVGIIIVAIIGNAAEHTTAVMVAMKNKMDLSLSIAVGSSLQISLFVAPILVLASYAMGAPMNFEFTLPELFAVIASVYIIAQISGDGESNWLEGVQLLAVYTILAILFYFLPDLKPLTPNP